MFLTIKGHECKIKPNKVEEDHLLSMAVHQCFRLTSSDYHVLGKNEHVDALSGIYASRSYHGV